MTQNQTTLGIIAGSGSLPKSLICACQKAKRPVFVIALKGHADKQILTGVQGAEVRVGAVGKMIRLFHQNKVQEVVLIGGVRRPSVAEIMPDWKALCILCRVGFKLSGDDSLLKVLVSEASRNGFNIRGVDDIMPELLAPEGVLGAISPSDKDKVDIERGIQVAKALGKVDVGQAVIVQRGLVLSVEGIEGTAELIKRSGPLRRKGGGGVLVKVAKPQQDRRVDLPTVGPDTVRAVYQAGFKGIAVEAGASLIADAEQMIREADRLHIFVVGITCKKN